MTDPNTRLDNALTPVGELRRDAMLGELLDSMRSMHRRRRLHWRIAATTALLLLVTGISIVTIRSTDRGEQVGPSINSLMLARIEMIQTDPRILQRFESHAISQADIIDDRALLAILSELQRPAGLIRSEGRTWLTRSVVDPPMTTEHGS